MTRAHVWTGGAELSVRGLVGTVAELVVDPLAVYLSPSGRRCRVVDVHVGGLRATLRYDLRDGTACHSDFGEGFTLARANWHLLRRVA